MEHWNEIRRRVLVEGVSRRLVMRETGLHLKTLAKILQHNEPPGYRQSATREQPKLGPYLGGIEAILKEHATMPRKQRHTTKRIWERLREWGYEGGYTVVKDVVREMAARTQEVFVPLVHRDLLGGTCTSLRVFRRSTATDQHRLCSREYNR